jgi:hypothetical protein
LIIDLKLGRQDQIGSCALPVKRMENKKGMVVYGFLAYLRFLIDFAATKEEAESTIRTGSKVSWNSGTIRTLPC